MAKRPTRAAAAAKRPAAGKTRTTRKASAGEAPSDGEHAKEVARAKGKAAAAAEPVTAATKRPATKPPAAKKAAGGRPAPGAKAAKARVAATKAAETRPPSAKAKPPAAGTTASARAKPAAVKAPAPGGRGATGKRGAAARAAARPTRAAAPTRRAKAKPTKVLPPYLAAELGQPVDHEGEAIGAGSRAAFADTELQKYTLQLWQQMQSRRGVNLHLPAMERAGVTIDQIWTTGVTDRLTTSSTADEVRRYRQKLLFRANLLESILTETVSELNRLGSVEPAPSRSLGESG